MAATELQNKPFNVVEPATRNLSDRVAEQVAEILQEAEARQPVRPAMVYRVPSPGVRYYF